MTEIEALEVIIEWLSTQELIVARLDSIDRAQMDVLAILHNICGRST